MSTGFVFISHFFCTSFQSKFFVVILRSEFVQKVVKNVLEIASRNQIVIILSVCLRVYFES